MKTTRIRRLVVAALLCSLAVTVFADTKKEKDQKKVRKLSQDTLQRLYKADPPAKAAVEAPLDLPPSATSA